MRRKAPVLKMILGHLAIRATLPDPLSTRGHGPSLFSAHSCAFSLLIPAFCSISTFRADAAEGSTIPGTSTRQPKERDGLGQKVPFRSSWCAGCKGPETAVDRLDIIWHGCAMHHELLV